MKVTIIKKFSCSYLIFEKRRMLETLALNILGKKTICANVLCDGSNLYSTICLFQDLRVTFVGSFVIRAFHKKHLRAFNKNL